MNTIMVTGIKSISQQQVNAMGLNGITSATVQMPSQEIPVKRTAASDARRVSQKEFLFLKKNCVC